MGNISLEERVAGLVLGTAVGDALGLPREGLSRQRARKIFGDRPIHHRLVHRYGMISDDTEHTCMIIQSLLVCDGDMDIFKKDFARRLKLWLFGIPAGVGFATLRSILKLIIGFSPDSSGVHSAGNGPAMRSAILGVYAGKNINKIKSLVRISTRITHTDPKAEDGALAIALCAQYAANICVEQFNKQRLFDILEDNLSNPDILRMLDAIKKGLETNLSSEEMANTLGFNAGVSGYIVHTVPVVIFCWLKHLNDFRSAVEDIILLGGDADTTGAIVGALAGVTLGVKEIPKDWISGIKDFPYSIDTISQISKHLSDHIQKRGGDIDGKLLASNHFYRIPRNIFFAVVVLIHGIRRIMPPY